MCSSCGGVLKSELSVSCFRGLPLKLPFASGGQFRVSPLEVSVQRLVFFNIFICLIASGAYGANLSPNFGPKSVSEVDTKAHWAPDDKSAWTIYDHKHGVSSRFHRPKFEQHFKSYEGSTNGVENSDIVRNSLLLEGKSVNGGRGSDGDVYGVKRISRKGGAKLHNRRLAQAVCPSKSKSAQVLQLKILTTMSA